MAEKRIKLTYKQLINTADFLGDVEFVEIEEGNGGNIVVYPDGSEDDKFTLDENGNDL